MEINFEMRKLNEILKALPWTFEVYGVQDKDVQNVHLDSRSVQTGDAFVAVRGSISDGHNFIASAIENGVTAIFCEKIPKGLSTKVTYIVTTDLVSKLAQIAQAFYGNPSKFINLVGVTGTNGKTTVATMFFNMLRAMGVSCGLMSTVKICLNELTINTSLTTPDIFSVYRYLKMMVDQDFNHAIMEVSSHAIDQGRVAGLEFAVAAFTNISHDHLDYHRTFRSYLETKQRLFTDLSQKAVAITNVDDRNGEVMTQLSKAKIKTYGLRNVADYKAKLLEFDFSGMHIQIGSHDFYTHLVGKFNVSNLLAVVAIADQLGFERMEVLTKLSQVKTAPGRFELVRNQQKDITSIVDYAHTPDALENVLKTIDQVNKRRGKVITVIGCGGDRDKTKRPLMAKVASRYSNQVILTSDNPRGENPEAILDDMEEGVEIDAKRKVLRIADRKSAIKTAVTMAQKQDVILVAGKGHETYQEIQGVKYPFDDKQILQDFLLE